MNLNALRENEFKSIDWKRMKQCHKQRDMKQYKILRHKKKKIIK